MADADEEEDPCPSPPSPSLSRGRNLHSSTALPLPDTDLSEETQDFRFLSSLIPTSTTTRRGAFASASIPDAATTTIPKRGEKDFEPNPTRSQQAALRASRQAMHDALSAERVHGPKNWVVGYFCGGVEERRSGVDGVEGSRSGGGGGGRREKDKRFQNCLVRVDQPKGPYFKTMGVSDSENRMWLLPEEALYLVERGSLDLRWDVPREESEGEDKDVTGGEDEGLQNDAEGGEEDAPSLSDLPMSLQGAYATFISDEDLTLARYTVFAGLRRSGYTVVRAPTWDDSPPSSKEYPEVDPTGSNTTAANKEITSPSPPTSPQSLFIWPSFRNFLTRIFQLLFRPSLSKAFQRQPNCRHSLGPLVAPGLYRSYADIYRALTLIPFHDPLSTQSRLSLPTSTPPSSTTSTPQPQRTTHPASTNPPFRICYHVYKPSTPYRKSSPAPPDFHLAVIDALSHPFIPSLTELGTLLEGMPIHDPKEDEKLKKGRPEMRLRTGTRSVVLAVVDNGVVSFLRVAEMGSGRERIYDGKGARGGGKHGRRGGVGGRRGRGRARG